jgi:hypothetical protein
MTPKHYGPQGARCQLLESRTKPDEVPDISGFKGRESGVGKKTAAEQRWPRSRLLGESLSSSSCYQRGDGRIRFKLPRPPGPDHLPPNTPPWEGAEITEVLLNGMSTPDCPEHAPESPV